MPGVATVLCSLCLSCKLITSSGNKQKADSYSVGISLIWVYMYFSIWVTVVLCKHLVTILLLNYCGSIIDCNNSHLPQTSKNEVQYLHFSRSKQVQQLRETVENNKATNIFMVVPPPQLILTLQVLRIVSFVSSQPGISTLCGCDLTVCVTVCTEEHVSKVDFWTELLFF